MLRLRIFLLVMAINIMKFRSANFYYFPVLFSMNKINCRNSYIDTL